MATYTTNYNLEKPEATDPFGDFRASYNDNLDIIDANLGGGGGSSSLAGLSDVDLSSPTDGQVLTYDGNNSKWVNANGSGGVSDVEVNGTSVVVGGVAEVTVPTATSDLTNDSGFIDSSALAPYALLASLASVATSGSYTDLSDTPTIPTVNDGILTIQQNGTPLGIFSANQSGNTTINIAGGSGGDSVAWTQIEQSGTKIAEIEINGVTTDVYAPQGAPPFTALIIITADTGSTITATKGGDTYTATEVTTGQYEVTVDSIGTWTISDGTLSDTVTVTAQTTYYVTLSAVPDGSTVLPTDDIQILLNCADIWDKAYTTLAELLSDTTTLLAVISSNNAIDYMVRSTTWAESVALVPTMTSNTTPSGVASASSVYADRASDQPYHALDGSNSYAWTPNTGSNTNYLQYAFEDTKSFYKFSITTNNKYTDEARVDTLTVSIGETEGTLTDVYSYNPNQVVFSKTDTFTPTFGKICRVTIAQSQGYKYCSVPFLQFYSASITSDSTAMTYIGLNNYASNTLLSDEVWGSAILLSDYVKSVMNIYTPNMTSATLPSGTVYGSSIGRSNGNPYYYPWFAFDGIDDATHTWESYPSNHTPEYVGYIFANSTKIRGCVYNRGGRTYGAKDVIIQGSNDTSETTGFTDIKNTTLADITDKQAIIFAEQNYSNYRFYISSIYNSFACANLVFYGREDV